MNSNKEAYEYGMAILNSAEGHTEAELRNAADTVREALDKEYGVDSPLSDDREGQTTTYYTVCEDYGYGDTYRVNARSYYWSEVRAQRIADRLNDWWNSDDPDEPAVERYIVRTTTMPKGIK